MEKKVLLALCLCLAVGLAGCVDPLEEEEDDDIEMNGNGDNGDNGDEGDEEAEEEGVLGEVDVNVDEMTVECEVQDRVVSPEETEDVDRVYSQAGPPFDERKAENMLHEELNGLREPRVNETAEQRELLCDPFLREIAQEHSRVMAEIGALTDSPAEVIEENDEIEMEANVSANPELGNASIRYEGVCEDPKERYGRWLYQRNRGINWDEEERPELDQRIVDVVQNHDDIIRDMRGVWFNDEGDLEGVGFEDEGAMEILTDENVTRQGIGMHIDRSSRLVHVTQAVC